MNWQNLIKKFVKRKNNINSIIFWYKNIMHHFYLTLPQWLCILNIIKNFFIFLMRIFKNMIFFIYYYFSFIIFVASILIFLKIEPTSVICFDNITVEIPEIEVFTEKHLSNFYDTNENYDKNLEKVVFSEAISILSFRLIEPANCDDRSSPLRQVLGKEHYEYFKNHSFYLIKNNSETSDLNYFLTRLVSHDSFIDKGFLESKLKKFISDYSLVYFNQGWNQKTSFGQQFLFYREFLVLEEMRPLNIKSVYKLYRQAIDSSKFFDYTYKNGIDFGQYTDYGKALLKNFLNVGGRDLSKNYTNLYSYSFDPETGFIYKLKNVLQHIYHMTFFYEKLAADYFFFLGNICLDELDILNFIYLNDYVTSNKETYLQFLLEIEYAKMLNIILYYPAIAAGHYYIIEIAKELLLYLSICLDKGIFKNTDDYVYVETLYGDHRIRRMVKKFLNFLIKGCIIHDEKTIAFYKKYAPIFHSLISDNRGLLAKKITYKEALEAIKFMLQVLDETKKEEYSLAKKCFPNIEEIRKKKIYAKYFISRIDVAQAKVFTIYYGPEAKKL